MVTLFLNRILILFSDAHGNFSRIDHILVTNWVSANTKRLRLFPEYSQTTVLLKLELNHKKMYGRNSNTWKLKTILLKNVWVNQ